MSNTRAIYFILAGICLLAYANSLNNAFVSDDITAILENPDISKFYRFWLDPHNLFNSFSYLATGDNPFVYHLLSIILHIINTFLVFSFLNLLFNTESSFAGSLLFAVHPIHTEAVTWISGRTHQFVAFFILTTYLLYCRATNPQSRLKRFSPFWYILALAVFSYSMVSSNFFLSLFPLLLVLSDVTFGKWRRHWKWWLPFIAVVCIRLILSENTISHRVYFIKDALNTSIARNPFAYIACSFYSHLWLLAWPVRLTLCHGSIVIPPSLAEYSIFLLLPVILVLYFTFKKAKEVFFALSIFILFLGPTYSPVPVVSSFIAERYIYFPSVALSIAAAFLYEKCVKRYARFKKYLLGILVFIAILYMLRTVLRNEDWRTPQGFWEKALVVSPDDVKVRNNLGAIYFKEGKITKAIEEFEKIIRLDPQYVAAYDNLAVACLEIGEQDKARYFWKRALEINPSYCQTHYNLSLMYFNTQQYSLAVRHCDEAVRLGCQAPLEFLRSLEPYRKK